MTRIIDYLIYLLVKGLAIIIWALPASSAFKLGEAIGKLLYKTDKRHRQVALENLDKVWGAEKSPQQLEEIARSGFVKPCFC